MMGAARTELEARLGETHAAAHFVDRAYQLRTRIGQAIRWDGPQHEIQLLRSFMDEDAGREEEILSALYVRSVAAFERYIRNACSEFVDARAALASAARNLPADLRQRNLILSARLLSTLDQPRDHIKFNPAAIIERLAACEKNSIPYLLNSVSFSSFVQSPTVEAVEKTFANVGLKDLFERLGRSTTLQQLLETKATRATSLRVQERLEEIVRWRNNFAHGGDDERTVTIDKFDSLVKFFRAVASGMDQAVTERLGQGFA